MNNPIDHICISLVLRARAGGRGTLSVTVILQFVIGVKLIVAAVTVVLVVSWEVLALYVA